MNRYYPHTIIAQEGWSFILGGLAASIFFSFLWGWWSLPFWIFTLFCVNFFRDPARNIPEAPDAIISPADGRIVVVERARDPYRDTEALKISVFMNVFDVHSQRSPVSGVVTDVKYTAGKFLNASLDKSSTENERNAVLMTTRTGREITFVQVAGLIARRVLCYVNKGDNMVRGERYGFIRFGSRVDVYLPLDATVNVAIGDRVRASETILAYLPLEASEPMPHQDLVNPSSQSVAENRLKADIQAAPFVETPFQAASQFAPVHESSLLDEARLAAATEHLKAETEAAKQAAEQARAQAELEIAKLKAEAEQARAQAEQAKAQAEAEVARLKAEAEAVQLKAQQEAQAASQAKAEAQAAKLKAEQEAQAAVQAKAQAEAAQLKAQQEAQAAQLKAQQEAQAAAQAKAQAEAEAQAAKLKAEQEAQAVAQAKAQAEAAQLKAQQEAAQAAQLKAQQEAQAKAQAEAEAQAAKLKAEQEAQAKAQQAAEAKARAEAVAKAQAAEKAKEEALAKAKADAEAKLKAEQAAKLKAEQEAKARAKAEQEAKAKAEQEALAEIAARKPIVRREVFAAVPEPWQTIEPREVIIRTEVVDKK